jgi:hypothetical protein
MTKTKRWMYVSLCIAGWAFVNWLYTRILETHVEPRMFANGQESYWWTIVLMYWIIDTAIVICFARAFARPFGLRMPAQLPFFQFASDAAILMLLVHVAYTCVDAYLFPKLMSVGLETAPSVFIVLAFVWTAVGLSKYRQLVKIVDRDVHLHAQNPSCETQQ